MRSLTLTSADQLMVAAGLAACLIWTLFATGAMAINTFSSSSQDAAAARTQAYYERLIADRQARLNSAVARLSSSAGSMDGLAKAVTERHAALAMLLTDLHGAPGAAQALAPIQPAALSGKAPADQIQSIENDQERMVAAAEGYAHSRADRLRLAFHLGRARSLILLRQRRLQRRAWRSVDRGQGPARPSPPCWMWTKASPAASRARRRTSTRFAP